MVKVEQHSDDDGRDQCSTDVAARHITQAASYSPCVTHLQAYRAHSKCIHMSVCCMHSGVKQVVSSPQVMQSTALVQYRGTKL